MTNRLHKSATNRVIAGVCGGLGEYFDVDPTFVRLLFVVLAIFQGIGILAYIVLWIVMPRASSLDLPPRDVVRENLGAIREGAERLGDQFRTRPAGTPPPEGEAPLTPTETSDLGTTQTTPGYASPRSASNRQMLAGAILIILGALFLLDNLRLFWWLNWGRMWPIVLVAIGVYLLYDRSRTRA